MRHHADQGRNRSRKVGALSSSRRLELCEPRADELIVRVVASGMCQTDLHGRDGYYAVLISGGVTDTKAPAWFTPSAAPWATLRPATMSSCRIRGAETCANCRRQRPNYCLARPQSEERKERALDGSTLLCEERRAGLWRVFPAILVRHFRAHARALRGQSATTMRRLNCSARSPAAARPARAPSSTS